MAKKKTSRPADDTPPRRFARTPENILVALGFPTKRENFANLKYWRTFKDFPKRERNGFDVEKLVEFLEAHKEEFAQRAARAKFIMAQAVPKTNAGGLSGDSGHAGDDEDEPLAPNQTALAEWLSRHFQVSISKQDISDWSKGKRLDGAPPPPLHDAAQRWPKLAWADWYRKHKFHDPAKITGTPDLFKLVEIESKKSELERLDHERFLRSKDRGHYLEKAEHNRILSSIGMLGRNTLWELFDHAAYDQLSVQLAEAGMPDEWRQVAMNLLRQMNPELLRKYMATMAAEIQANEKEIPETKPAQ